MTDNVLVKHWRGDLSLSTSFWIAYVAVFCSALLAFFYFLTPLLMDGTPAATVAYFFFGQAILAGLFCWQSIGLWHASVNYVRSGKGKTEAILARAGVGLGALVLCGMALKSIPFMFQQFEFAIGIDRELRANGDRPASITPSGNFVRLQGWIVWGVERKLKQILDKRPDIEYVELNSPGGRARAALRIAQLIKERGLSTYVRGVCSSACTFVFIAGRERILNAGGRLGFHSGASRLKGGKPITPSEINPFRDHIEMFMREAGVAEWIIEQQRLTPNKNMWFPNEYQLLDGGVVSRVVNR